MKGLSILVLRAARLARRAPVRSLTTGVLVTAAVALGSLGLSESRGHYEVNSSAESQLGQADVRYDLYANSLVPQFGNSLVTPTTIFDMATTVYDGPPFDSVRPEPAEDVWALEDRLPVDDQIDAVLAALPEGSDVAMLESFESIEVGTSAISNPVTVHQGPWSDPLLTGMVDLADGRLPGPGEVVVPPSLAVAIGVGIGDRLVTRHPVAVLEVVGLGSTGTWPQLVVASGEFVVSDSAAADSFPPMVYSSVLAELPPGATAPAEVHVGKDPDDGLVARPLGRDSFAGPPPTGSSTGIVVFVTAFVAVTAGAAFGIGAARRRRALGLLAANGATEHQLRLASGAEALVVSVPAVVIGAVLAVVMPGVWVQLRLPGWDRLWQVVVPLPWVGLLAVAAMSAAVLGATLFSRSVSAATVPALLDSRSAVRRTAQAQPRWGVMTVLLIVVLVSVLVFLPVIALVGPVVPADGRAWVVLAGLVAWCAGATAVIALARWVLARNAIGRLVGRDLTRRPLGAGAAVIVIALWSSVAVGSALLSGLGGFDSAGESWNAEPSTEPGQVTDSAIVTIRPPADGAVLHRSSMPPEEPGTLPPGLRDQLAELGLQSEWATIGQFSGSCPVCPDGVRPAVMVLESIDGLGFPERVDEALRAGAVVTPFSFEGLDGSTVGGMPVTVAPLPIDVSAAMLREFAPEGQTLDDPVQVLVGSSAGMSDAAAEAAILELAEAGAEVGSDDPRLQPVNWAEANGLGLTDPNDRYVRGWAASVLVLMFVTMAATAAHRREHGEAAHVLWVLGAGPDAGRRLASLTAGSIAAVGVLLGSTTAAVVAVPTWLGSEDLPLGDVFEAQRILVVLAVIFVVPATASLLGRLLPPARSVRADLRPA